MPTSGISPPPPPPGPDPPRLGVVEDDCLVPLTLRMVDVRLGVRLIPLAGVTAAGDDCGCDDCGSEDPCGFEDAWGIEDEGSGYKVLNKLVVDRLGKCVVCWYRVLALVDARLVEERFGRWVGE
jgi:hypothetical protein